MTTHCSGSRPTVSIRSPEDLLALIPHQLGYEPRDCAVLFVPVPGGGALCLKLRTPIHDGDVDAFARELSGVLAGVEHSGQAAVVVYSGGALLDEAENDFRNAAWLGVAVQRCGLRALSGLVVGPRHWWDLEALTEPRPVSAIADSALNAHMIALGSAVQPHAPGEPPPLPKGYGQRVSGFLAAVAAASAATGGAEGPWDTGDTGQDLFRWDRALAAVAVGTREGTGVVLALPDDELALLVVSLGCGVTRDALLYAWLTGDCERATRAALGLRAAVARLRAVLVPDPRGGGRRDAAGVGESADPGGPAGTRNGWEHAEEALRCARTVMGQWEGRPHWDSVEAAYRILEVLDSLFSRAATGVPPEGATATSGGPWNPGLPAGLARNHADVVCARAQLELYRGRAFTANALLQRCDTISARRPGTAAVLRRLQLQDVPWWCKDPRTAWPGRSWWDTRHAERRAGEKYF